MNNFDTIRELLNGMALAMPATAEKALTALDALEAENARLKGLLGDCLDWMESIRSSGDCGYWEWAEDEYTRGIAALENKP